MVIIRNRFIPFRGFSAVNLFGVLFARDVANIDRYTINHEEIHTAQMKELGYIFFYIIYFFEWLFRLVFHTATAYLGISFEKEAYTNQNDLEYLETRRHWAQWRKRS